MRKTSSCTSYSEFRKKTTNLSEACGKDVSALMEIDQMSKQLDTLGAAKRKAGIEEKYLSNNAIMEVEEEESPQVKLTKKNALEASKSKKMANKNLKFQVPVQKKITQPLNKNNSSFHNKKTNKEDGDKNNKFHSDKKPHSTQTCEKKTVMERRRSLKTTEQPSLMSTWSSVDLTKNFANQEDKEQMYRIVERISEKMGKKMIGSEAMEKILEQLESVDKILDSF